MNEAVIVTGASRGLGAAFAAQLLSPQRRLVCIARAASPQLEAQARAAGAPLEYVRHDLSDVAGTESLARDLFARLADEARASAASAQGAWRRIVLINNAGVIEPIAPIEQLDAARIRFAMDVNLLAPMVLTSRFLEATRSLQIERRVLNISSGAGRRPTEGWSVYTTSKAALDMYTRCVKAEQAMQPHPARVVSLAPGVVDTTMQATVRSADPTTSPTVARLRAVKEAGGLATPEDTARRILAYLDRADFGDKEIDDIREAG